MVKLEEVLDEEFNNKEQAGPGEQEDEWDTDSESEQSSASDADELDESLADRLAALKDVIPPAQRRWVAGGVAAAGEWVQAGLALGGKTLWVVSTSALLLGVPWALAFGEEQQMMEMEREMKMQQSASDMLTQQQTGGAGGKPAL